MHRNSWRGRGNMVSEKGHAEWRVSNFQAGTAALLSLEPFTQCCSFPCAGRCFGHAGVVGTLVYGCWARPRAATSRDGIVPFSLWHCLTTRPAPLPTPQERKGSKEILSLSSFLYYTYTSAGNPSQGSRQQYRWSTGAQPSALLKGMSEGPGHPRFDPASKTASPGLICPEGGVPRGRGCALIYAVPHVFAVPVVLFAAVFSAQNRCSVDVWWVGVGRWVQVQR